jgi:NDP-sugar pyrophosphorylase family protein
MNIKINYIREDKPLGTAGALSLLDLKLDDTFIVTNGDVITDIRYAELLDFHLNHNAEATMAVNVHEWQNPYGVVDIKGIEINGFVEKPINKTHINAGVYALSKNTLNYLKKNVHCDMPFLFELLRKDSKRVIAYPMHEPWLDVGVPEDLKKANKENE